VAAEIEALRREMREERARFDARVDALRAELDAQKAARPAGDDPSTPKPPVASVDDASWLGLRGPLPGRGVWGFSAYVQAQYQQSQASADQVAQDGSFLNQDEFLVRRGRLRLDAAWEHAELAVEVDANTINGPVFGPRRVNASLVYWGRPWDGQLVKHGPRGGEPPIARLTMGLTSIPFGFELQDSHRDRVFLERTQASAAFFPGEQDVGAVLSGGVGFFRYAIAAMDGEPLGDKASVPVGDPTHAKDLVARLGADSRPSDSFRVTGGVSALYGTGFHAGTPASKSALTWVDLNGDGMVQVNELSGTPSIAATPSATFTRWAVGVDLELRLKTPIGWSMLYGEATVATNLDRGLFVADPISTGVNVRELGGYAAFVQEITRYGLAGFRFDYYDPNADFFQKTAGQLVPVSQAIYTFSPVVGVQLPDRARLTFEYDAIRNLLGVDSRGVPTNLAIDHFAVRLQVQL
jgi:hypothetical protein